MRVSLASHVAKKRKELPTTIKVGTGGVNLMITHELPRQDSQAVPSGNKGGAIKNILPKKKSRKKKGREK